MKDDYPPELMATLAQMQRLLPSLARDDVPATSMHGLILAPGICIFRPIAIPLTAATDLRDGCSANYAGTATFRTVTDRRA
jgi:hypothetical protein